MAHVSCWRRSKGAQVLPRRRNEISSQLSSIPSAAAGLFHAGFFPSVRPICCNDLLTTNCATQPTTISGSQDLCGWKAALPCLAWPGLAGLLPFGRLHSCALLVSVSGADNICLAPTWPPITFKLANSQLFDPVAMTLIWHSHWIAAHYRAHSSCGSKLK